MQCITEKAYAMQCEDVCQETPLFNAPGDYRDGEKGDDPHVYMTLVRDNTQLSLHFIDDESTPCGQKIIHHFSHATSALEHRSTRGTLSVIE